MANAWTGIWQLSTACLRPSPNTLAKQNTLCTDKYEEIPEELSKSRWLESFPSGVRVTLGASKFTNELHAAVVREMHSVSSAWAGLPRHAVTVERVKS